MDACQNKQRGIYNEERVSKDEINSTNQGTKDVLISYSTLSKLPILRWHLEEE